MLRPVCAQVFGGFQSLSSDRLPPSKLRWKSEKKRLKGIPIRIMGKRKAVGPPAPLEGIKKQKKRPRKTTIKPAQGESKSLDEIDQLFEEVEAILNSELGTHGLLPLKKPPLQPKTIQEFFIKNREARPVNTGGSTDCAGKSSAVNATAPSFLQGIVSGSNISNHFQTEEILHMEEMERTPLPLSPEIRLVPNIPCKNRFELLSEGSAVIEVHDPPTAARAIEAASSLPITTDMCSDVSDNAAKLPLILQRVDEIKNLVLQLTKLLQGNMAKLSGCICQKTEAEGAGGTLAADSATFNTKAREGLINHAQRAGW
ncbi:hypothetical protein NDU88_006420 [Pleurodeles waltl]|uniref:Uncharacterized protein n=1 Tax=Pleurodeles waltl TaxID=8319 RepID=A0AAV7RMG0_PLEWA|nr:hypothetical protein NDU88_006420 [Pleurodeles waltl]